MRKKLFKFEKHQNNGFETIITFFYVSDMLKTKTILNSQKVLIKICLLTFNILILE